MILAHNIDGIKTPRREVWIAIDTLANLGENKLKIPPSPPRKGQDEVGSVALA